MDYESWMPDFMKGLAKGIEDSKNMVAKAMEGVASDMVLNPAAAISGVETSGSGSVSAGGNYEYVSGPLVEVREMVVRSDDDIRRVSQELNKLMKAGRRARGLV